MCTMGLRARRVGKLETLWIRRARRPIVQAVSEWFTILERTTIISTPLLVAVPPRWEAERHLAERDDYYTRLGTVTN